MIAFCKLLDSWMLNRQKRRLHDLMSSWWVGLAETRVPELHRFMAARTIKIAERVYTEGRSRRRIFVRLLCTSFALTTTALILGFLASALSVLEKVRDVLSAGLFFVVSMFLINFTFDLITSVITFRILKGIRDKSAQGIEGI